MKPGVTKYGPTIVGLLTLLAVFMLTATQASAQSCNCTDANADAVELVKYDVSDDGDPTDFDFESGTLGDVAILTANVIDGEIRGFTWQLPGPEEADFMMVKYDGLCDVVPESANDLSADTNPGRDCGEPTAGDGGTCPADGEGLSGNFGPTNQFAISHFNLCSTSITIDVCENNQLPYMQTFGSIQGPSGARFRDVKFTDPDGDLIQIVFLTLQNIDVVNTDGNWTEGPGGTWTPTAPATMAEFTFNQQPGNNTKAIFLARVTDDCDDIDIDPAMEWDDGAETPAAFLLDDNYPNPFNPTTTIHFQLAEAGPVSVKVYDMLGREVQTLLNQHMESGTHQVEWNGTNATGRSMASGMYLYRMEAGTFAASKTMMLVK